MQKQEEFFKKEANNAKVQKNNILKAMHLRLKEKRREEVEKRGKKIAIFAAVFTLGLIFSGKELLFSTYPLGISLICGIGEYYLAAALGAVFGGVVNGVGKEYILACLSVFIIRFFMFLPLSSRLPSQIRSDAENVHKDVEAEASGELDGSRAGAFYKFKTFVYKLFRIPIPNNSSGENVKPERKEKLGFKLIISAVGGFVYGLFLLLQNEFSYYSLLSLIFMLIACPLFAWLLSGLFDLGVRRGGFMNTLSIASAMILCTWASSYILVFDIMLTPMLAMLFTLISCRLRGIASSLFVAFFTGLCFDAGYIPMLMMAAIAFVMLRAIKLSLAMATVAGICLGWSYYFSDMLSFVRILPPTLIAIPIFLIFEKYIKVNETNTQRVERENKYFAKSVSEESKNQAVMAKMSSLSEAFSSLSQAVSSLSDKFRRPDALGLREITDCGFERVCRGCPNFDVCFGAEYNRTVEAAGRITSALHKKGYVDKGDLGEGLSAICVRRKKLIDEMNNLCAERTERIIRGQKTEIFASSYDDIKDILQDAVKFECDEYECDTVTGGKIYDYLRSEGYDAEGVVVCGKRCKRVMLKGVNIKCDAHDESAKNMCKNISEIVGVSMIGPVFEVGDDGVLMLFSAKPKLRAVCARGRRAMFECSADDVGEVNPFDKSADRLREETCGDVTNAFLTDTSYFYSLISDGMGSGVEAASSAGVSSMFCEKMLMAGNRADITIRMLNNFLRGENSQRGVECSVTVDLFELDLMMGVASFIKSGAAPTYILRGGEVYKIASKTMPVGIIKNPDIKVTRFDMKSGDLVLMMSDGICGESDECEWIVETLCDVRLPENAAASFYEGERFASALRDKIFDIAKEKMRQANKFDDVSLSVVLVL